MQKRPIIKLHLSKFDKGLEAAGFIMVLLLWILTAVVYSRLPVTIPTHFNFSGVPDDFGSKTTLIVLPVIGTIIFGGLTLLNRNPHIFNYASDLTRENAEQRYTNATRMIRFLKLAIVVIFFMIVLFTYLTATGKARGLGIWFLPFVFLLTLSPTVYYIVKRLRTK